LDLAVLSALGEDPLLGLEVGGATAAAAAVPAVPATPNQPTTAPPEQERSMPRTGGEAALPLTLALLAVGAAGAVLIRRTRPVCRHCPPRGPRPWCWARGRGTRSAMPPLIASGAIVLKGAALSLYPPGARPRQPAHVARVPLV